MDADIKPDLTTRTHNCSISILCESRNGSANFVKFENEKDKDNLKKSKKKERRGNGNVKQPNYQSRNANNKSVLTDEERTMRLYASISPAYEKTFLDQTNTGKDEKG